MKFLALDAENVLRLSAFHVDLSEGNMIEFTSEGKNAQGKTSAIRTMMALILGKRALPDKLLKDGEDKGYIEAEIGNDDEVKLIVRLDISPNDEKLTVKSAEGGKLAKPQAVLDALNAHLGFNPLHFIEMGNTAEGRKKQLDEIVNLIGFDIESYENEYRSLYDERQDVGRDKKQKEGHFNSLPKPPRDTPRSEISVMELTEELAEATLKVATSEGRSDRIAKLEEEIESTPKLLEKLNFKVEEAHSEFNDELDTIGNWEEEQKKKIEFEAKDRRERAQAICVEKENRFKEGISQINNRLEEANGELKEQQSYAETTPPNLDALKEKLTNVEEINRNVRTRKDRLKAQAAFDEVSKQYEELTDKIENLKAGKEKALRDANLPVEGLSFDTEGLLYNDVPLQQASSAEKIEIACAILIESQKAKAEETGKEALKVILIEEASLLGNEMYERIAKLAKKHGYQVILETVRQIGDCAIVIQNGEVKE